MTVVKPSVDITTWRLDSVTGSEAESGGDAQTAKWKVSLTAPSATAVRLVRGCPYCPQIGSLPPIELGLGAFHRCVDVRVAPLGDSPTRYTVEAAFAIRGSDILGRFSIAGGAATNSRAIYRDLDDKPFLNSAGQAFTPVPEVPDGSGAWAAQVRRLNPRSLLNASWTINSSPVWGFEAKTLRIGQVRYRSAIEGGLPHFAVDVPVDYRPSEWTERIADGGYNYLLEGKSTDAYHPVTGHEDHRGEAASVPVFLDGAGGVLAKGAALVYLDFRIYESIDFGSLGLPGPFDLQSGE